MLSGLTVNALNMWGIGGSMLTLLTSFSIKGDIPAFMTSGLLKNSLMFVDKIIYVHFVV